MSWQAKGIEKKQSEEKIYKRGASPPFLYSSLFIRNIFVCGRSLLQWVASKC